ncbi:hypothetical protein AMTR_s00093p00153360 [Amborella trichopoda]|uniref:Uncharacterized protein n=1 Tax=Amborella trichopoda TaxID=13333 RepID=W1NSR2_AMBTC|nr:hypothetical protein AMTR_s00093p00153360 [Amborella trichopoda]
MHTTSFSAPELALLNSFRCPNHRQLFLSCPLAHFLHPATPSVAVQPPVPPPLSLSTCSRSTNLLRLPSANLSSFSAATSYFFSLKHPKNEQIILP